MVTTCHQLIGSEILLCQGGRYVHCSAVYVYGFFQEGQTCQVAAPVSKQHEVSNIIQHVEAKYNGMLHSGYAKGFQV